MKKLLALLLLLPLPVLAGGPPFRYETTCYLESPDAYLIDNCVVIETREDSGALRTRNIFSNRFGLTIKSRFDEKKGFVTWDSHNKFAYSWQYEIGEVNGEGGYSYVMPGVLVKDLSWD